METTDGRAQAAHSNETSRPEMVFVLLLLQSILWMVAGISAIPFALAGELHMAGLGLAGLMMALLVCLLAIGVLWRRRWARRTALGLELACLLGSALQLSLQIGANHGPVGLLTNVVVPAAVIWLLWGRKVRSVFS
jgi:hypothetical protein